MFAIKKKEASPLYRKCRLSAPIKAAMKDRTAGTRRVRSAEVFTLRGQWTKAPKANAEGGELLPRSRAGVNSATYSEGKGKREEASNNGGKSISGVTSLAGGDVDFCVTNSLDKTNDVVPPPMPRVNHDSFDRRIHPSIIKRNAKTSSNAALSPRTDKDPQSGLVVVKNGQEFSHATTPARAKSESVLKPSKDTINDLEENTLARQSSAKTLPKSHKVSESKTTNKNSEEALKQKQRITSASQKSLKTSTDLNTSVGEAEIKRILNGPDPDSRKDGYPTFCSKCSGIYSGNAPPPPTPVTCGSCVHGISMHGNKTEVGPSNAEIQKELAKRLVRTEKVYNQNMTNATIELKMAESRVNEDSIHYSQERKIVQSGKSQAATLSLLKTTDENDFPDDIDLSIQDCDNDNDESLDVIEYKPICDDERGQVEEAADRDRAVDTTDNPKIPIVNILSEDNHDGDEKNQNWDRHDSIEIDNDKLSASLIDRRLGNRRMSIHFTYKPEVGNISISNQLLHVLSIDDCKQAMRYHPHKVLEKHEIADNPFLMLTSSIALQNAEENEDQASSDGKHAMRISKGSAITSLPSSTANNATNVNKKQYKILFDPEDLDYYRNKRPSSLSLAKAFNTLIHDRTIMQRLDTTGSRMRTKTLNNVGKTTEGPKYKLINAAMKRQMGEQMQFQRQQLVNHYQRKKSGLPPAKKRVPNSSASLSSGRSLSLDSLPSVAKGIWKDSNESVY